MIDVNRMRDPVIALHGLKGADRPYVFYYDETNNIRRLLVTESGLNNSEVKPFVLGGVAHSGSAADYDFDLAELREELQLQKSVNELKLKHLGKGDFLQALNAKKIGTFLGWIQKRGLFRFTAVLDPCTWSTVDIIDSILTEIGDEDLMMRHLALKNDLYALLRRNVTGAVSLFQKFAYPNVGRANRLKFVEELWALLESTRDAFTAIDFPMLKRVLQSAATLESVPYLEDEKPNVLIDEFSMFYLHRICLFKNSTHVLDTEDEIKARFSHEEFLDNGHVLNSYRFVRSHDEPGVQIADVIVGLIGKCFDYVIRTTMPELVSANRGLTPLQRKNLEIFSRILDASTDENAAFAHYTLSAEDQTRAALLLRA